VLISSQETDLEMDGYQGVVGDGGWIVLDWIRYQEIVCASESKIR